jgi:hypothetical protein
MCQSTWFAAAVRCDTVPSRENSKNDPVNVLYSEFDPKCLDISINDPLQCVFFA